MTNNTQLMAYGYADDTIAIHGRNSNRLFTMQSVANMLGKTKGIGRNKLINLLRNKNIIDNQNHASIEMVKAGLFVNQYRKINGVNVNVIYSTLSGLNKIRILIDEL